MPDHRLAVRGRTVGRTRADQSLAKSANEIFGFSMTPTHSCRATAFKAAFRLSSATRFDGATRRRCRRPCASLKSIQKNLSCLRWNIRAITSPSCCACVLCAASLLPSALLPSASRRRAWRHRISYCESGSSGRWRRRWWGSHRTAGCALLRFARSSAAARRNIVGQRCSLCGGFRDSPSVTRNGFLTAAVAIAVAN